MIVDRIENAHLLEPLHRRFKQAFAVLADPATARQPDGRYPVDGEDLYYIIQHYATRPIDPDRFESHKKYIDIQALMAGEEIVYTSPIAGLEVTEPYSEAKDIMFHRAGTPVAQTRLQPGIFCLLCPQDAHLPCCQVTCPAPVHKVVFKIRVE